MEKGLVLLQDDFNEGWLSPLQKAGIRLLGLHADPRRAGVREFLDFVERQRKAIERFEEAGIRVEYKLHALAYLLPRELFASDSALFRMNEKGERTDDYNACPSSSEALALIERGAERLARLLRQNSHRYHFWPDDDLGGDIGCRCEKCRRLSAAQQNLRFCEAMLRGIRKYDGKAKLSFLVYGEEAFDGEPPEGLFLEYAPFKRRHDLPLAQGEPNASYRARCENLISRWGGEESEILEYFLSYDYAAFCRDGKRTVEDIDYYRSLGVGFLTTFTLFPKKNYVEKHGYKGIMKYALL